MIRISFRQGMLLGFVVIVMLLGGAVLQSWRVLEHLVAQSRQTSTQAIQLTAEIQELGERTVDLERSARQYLLLNDPVFRQRFYAHLAQALTLVDHLDSAIGEPLSSQLGGWRMVAGALRNSLEQQVDKAELTPLLARLVELNGLIKQTGQRWIDAQNNRVLSDLDDNRRQLGLQIALALMGAMLAAVAMGWWLVRPVRQLEQAISRLGASRFDEVVLVGGPIDLQRLGKRLDWLRTRLAELETDRERALRHVSHELKTPLTALKEGVALLHEEVAGPLAGNQKEVVDILHHNVVGLQRQIESLLSLNAAAFAARRLKVGRVDLGKLMADVVHRRDLHIQSRHLDVQIETSSVQDAVLDGEKMSVVLDNLLSNAIDFSPEGGIIRLLASRTEHSLRFECIDQGAGVAIEDRRKIFDPFVRGQRQAPTQRLSSGIGLSIVRELVRAMGGHVGLLPAENGAHFYVELPDDQ